MGTTFQVFRPRVEALEARLAPARPFGVPVIDNFSSDVDPSQPGFDSSGDFAHAITGGFNFEDYSGSGLPSSPDAHTTLPHALFLFGSDRITFPGLAADEIVTFAKVSFAASSEMSVTFQGLTDSFTVHAFPTFMWQAASVTSNHIGDGGNPVGPIQSITLFSFEAMFDTVTILIDVETPYTPYAPEAEPDVADVEPGQTVSIDVLSNDRDRNGEELTVTAVTGATLGHATVLDNQVRYEAVAGTHGTDTLTYTIDDGHGGTATSTVAVTVNRPPSANPDSYSLPHLYYGSFRNDLTGPVLANDFDPDGDPLQLTIVVAPLYGTVELAADGTFIYMPTTPDNRLLEDSFVYLASDGHAGDRAAVRLMVENHAPAAEDVSYQGLLGHAALGEPVSGVFPYHDADGDPVRASVVRQPRHGSVTIAADGLHYLYQLLPGDITDSTGNITDSFTFKVNDRLADSNVATVSLGWPNTPPHVEDATWRVNLNHDVRFGRVALPVEDILRDRVDTDGDRILIDRIVTQPGHGTLSLDFGDGAFIYEPFDAGSEVEDDFSFMATDGWGLSNVATVRLSLRFEQYSGDDEYTVSHRDVLHVPLNCSVFVNDLDERGLPVDPFDADFHAEVEGVDAFPRPASVEFDTEHGHVVFFRDGTFTYEPAPGFIGGDDTFRYGWSAKTFGPPATARVVIHVTDEPPVAVPGGPYVVFEGQSVSFDGTASFDPDGDPLTFQWSAGLNRYLEGPVPTVTPELLNNSFIPSPVHVADLQLTVSDGVGQASAWTTLTVYSDGIGDEDANGGDGNHDGIPDRLQGNVASFHAGVDLTLVSPAGTTLVAVGTERPLPPWPTGYYSVWGALRYQLWGLAPGAAAVVTIIPEFPFYIDTFYKFGPLPDDPATVEDERTPHWYEFLDNGVTGAVLLDANGQTVAPHTHGAVARIELHLQDGGCGDDDMTANGVIVDPGAPLTRLDPPTLAPPTIESIRINDGAVQRSMVKSITVTFDRQVAVDPRAFMLTRQPGRRLGRAPLPALRVALSVIDGKTVARLTFSGPGVIGGSLPDGVYRLTIAGAKIVSAAGTALDGDADGAPGGNRALTFHRLFGDSDGDGDVDAADRARLRRNLRQRARAYVAHFDFNADGVVNRGDLRQLRRRLWKR